MNEPGRIRHLLPKATRIRWIVNVVSETTQLAPALRAGLECFDEIWVPADFQVKALTAEGRMSAILLAFLPPGVGLMMYTLNPGYMNALFHDSLGKMLLIGATVLAVVGFMWMKKMIEVEA